MSAVDVDGNNDDELAVDFGPLGLWLRNGSSWSQYSSVDPDFLVAADTDGTGDVCDGCPDDPDKIEPGLCGCGVPDEDIDEDGVWLIAHAVVCSEE